VPTAPASTVSRPASKPQCVSDDHSTHEGDAGVRIDAARPKTLWQDGWIMYPATDETVDGRMNGHAY
jgi:hypothetical protein